MQIMILTVLALEHPSLKGMSDGAFSLTQTQMSHECVCSRVCLSCPKMWRLYSEKSLWLMVYKYISAFLDAEVLCMCKE